MAGLTRMPLLALDLLWFSLVAEWRTGAGGARSGGRGRGVESAVDVYLLKYRLND